MNRYIERIDRNLGIITAEQQDILRNSTIGIAGCGGMGGHLAVAFARIGVGHLKIADNQTFDISNLNRQYAAKLSTLGANKAASTAEEIFSIVDDVEVEIFQEGITAKNVSDFVRGCSMIADEIEFFEIKARIWLHQAARKKNLDIFNCNVVGFGTRIFRFAPAGMTMEEFLEIDENTTLGDEVIMRLVKRLAPELPSEINPEIICEWVLGQHKAPIFGGTPLISAGIAVNRICMHLWGGNLYSIFPSMPAYAFFDSRTFDAGFRHGKWW